MIKFLTAMLCAAFLALVAPQAQALNTAAYYANDAAIEALFERAEAADVVLPDEEIQSQLAKLGLDGQTLDVVRATGEDIAIALLLCFFFGYLGMHRVYLGSNASIIALYCFCSLSCFGGIILVGIDFLMILFGGIDRFIDNDSFIAWW